jgi:two-component system sensor histidine kinase/response regulator
VVLAENGAVAVDRVRNGGAASFDIVLMDLQLPEMDGFEATRQIHEIDPTLPVVAQSAHAFSEERGRCFAAGMVAHIAKPIDPARFYDLLARWLPGHDILHGPAAAPAAGGTDAAAQAALRRVPGLDVDAGLSRLLGRWSAYESLLRRFRTGQRFAAESALAALGGNRLGDAQRSMHTLRATAGAIGATKIAAAAARAEDLLRASGHRDAAGNALREIDTALRQLEDALALALPVLAPPSPVDAVDLAELGPILDELERLLERDDVRAADLFATHAAALRAALGAQAEAIERDVSGYAMPEALQTLRRARAGGEGSGKAADV